MKSSEDVTARAPTQTGLNPLHVTVRNALVLRFLLACALHLLPTEDLLAPDQSTYHVIAEWLARYWSGETLAYPWLLQNPGPKHYYYVVAGIYSLLGPYSLFPKLLNAGLGAYCVAVVYDLASRLSASPAVALRAARFAAYFPSLVLWSVLNIRDVWVILIILLVCREIAVLHEAFRVRSFVILGFCLLALVGFRQYILLPMTIPALASFVMRNRAHFLRNAVAAILVATVVSYADRVAGQERRLRSLDLEELQFLREAMAQGSRSRAAEADISTPGKALIFLPQGLAFFMLAPFPWVITGLRQVLTLPEMLFFYALLPKMWTGVLQLLRRGAPGSLAVLLVTTSLTVGYALGTGNAGTAYRHRAQLLSFYLIFAAVGLEAQQNRRSGIRPPAFPALPAPRYR